MGDLRIFIFKTYSESVKYGVGTYVDILTNNISNIEEVYIVELFYPNCKKFEYDTNKKYVVLRIPFRKDTCNIVDGIKIDIRTAKYIWDVLFNYLDGKVKIVFHFQTPFLYELIKIIKTTSYKIVYTLHKLRWKYYFNCNFETYKYLMSDIIHDPYINFVKNKIKQEKKICEICDQVIVLTNQAKKYLIDEYQICNKKIHIIRNGIKINKSSSKLTFKTKSKYFRFLFIGRVCEEKGVRFLLESFDMFLKEFPKSKLIIAGAGNLLEFSPSSLKNITHLGHLEHKNISSLIKSCDVGLIPSLNEECSYVALEMMSNKIPIICSNLSGLREMFKNNKNALKCDSYYDGNGLLKLDVLNLKNLMIKLYRSPYLRNKLVNNADSLFVKKYNVDLMISKTMNVYMNQYCVL